MKKVALLILSLVSTLICSQGYNYKVIPDVEETVNASNDAT